MTDYNKVQSFSYDFGYASITQPFTEYNTTNKFNEILNMYKILKYSNDAVLQIASDILEEAAKQNKNNIKISRTGENELLIYREVNGEFRNIIIDNDADIEYLNIPVNREGTYNEHHPFVGHIDIPYLVGKL